MACGRFVRSRCGRFGDGRRRVCWARSGTWASVSASASWHYPRRLPSRLTSRSSRPRVVASAMCFTLRLHMSAAPPQGGLTQALGGRKAFDGFAFQCSFSRLRLALLFGRVPAAFLLRSSASGALTHRRRYVRRLRKRRLLSVSTPATDAVISDRSGSKFTGARSSLPTSVFGKCVRVRLASASTAT